MQAVAQPKATRWARWPGPAGPAMLAAKAAVVTGWAVAAAAAAVLGSVLAGRLILPGRGLSAANGYVLVSLGNGPDLRAALGSVLYLALIGLLASALPPRSATPPPASAWSSACRTCSRSSAP